MIDKGNLFLTILTRLCCSILCTAMSYVTFHHLSDVRVLVDNSHMTVLMISSVKHGSNNNLKSPHFPLKKLKAFATKLKLY